MQKMCRTCLGLVGNNNFIHLNEEIQSKLVFCLPTMNPHLTPDPVLCIPCLNSLNSTYEFMWKCLMTEEILRNEISYESEEESNQGMVVQEDTRRSPYLILQNNRNLDQTLLVPEEAPLMEIDDDLINSPNQQIVLPECRVIVTPLEDIIKENLKNLLRSTYKELDKPQDEVINKKNSLIRECSVIITPLEYTLRENIRKFGYNSNNSEQSQNGEGSGST